MSMPAPVAPYHPPPAYPPPPTESSSTDSRAASSLVFAILGLIFAVPLGLPGMIAGPIAYFLGRGSRTRIAESGGTIGGLGLANAGRILGIVTTAVGAVVTLLWLIVIFNALNDVGVSSE
ncbi:MAG TPA: hypothetical protein VI384_00330 [Candidatus Dormibacteraeota bacterium]